MITFVLDKLSQKFNEWLDKREFDKRMRALQPDIERAMAGALQNLKKDPWFTGTYGYYYNIKIRISGSATINAFGGAMTITGFPTPSIVNVSISSENISAAGPLDEQVHQPGKSEGTTGNPSVLLYSKSQVVTFSVPVDSKATARPAPPQ